MQYGSEIDFVDNNGQTPIFYAIKTGRYEICEFLLKNGVK